MILSKHLIIYQYERHYYFCFPQVTTGLYLFN